jgi:hypothetical protein
VPTFTLALYDVGNGAVDVAVGQLDGDAKADIATCNADDGTVSILVNDGNGGFPSQMTVNVGDQPVSIDAADLDQDGRSDLAVAAVDPSFGPAVQVLINTGSPLSFASPITFGVSGDPKAVACADLNNDHVPDLVTANVETGGGGSVTALVNSSFPCPWDCDGGFDRFVGITDLFAMFGDWGAPGPCDFDGAGTGITDLFALFGAWGPCPPP